MELASGVLPLDVGGTAFAVTGGFVDGRGMSWMPTSGTKDIGGVAATAVSLDGRTIAGRAVDGRNIEHAAIWTGGRNWRLLGSFAPQAQPCDNLLSSTFGASDDGRVIVGLGWNGCGYARAFRWEESTGMVDLGSTNGRSSRANDVSGDGRVVVGWQTHPTGLRMAAKWVNRQPAESITRPGGLVIGEAFAANHDGSLIVGAHCEPENEQVRSAWTWTAATGVRCYPVTRPPGIPVYPYSTFMLTTNDDGRVIGGAFSFGLDSEALLWLDGQPHFLKEYLRANGYPDAFRGWFNTGFVQGVSPDGRTIVGYGAGPRDFQGYIVILPERGSN
jgi:probable HAF family extracellular repeat protein